MKNVSNSIIAKYENLEETNNIIRNSHENIADIQTDLNKASEKIKKAFSKRSDEISSEINSLKQDSDNISYSVLDKENNLHSFICKVVNEIEDIEGQANDQIDDSHYDEFKKFLTDSYSSYNIDTSKKKRTKTSDTVSKYKTNLVPGEYTMVNDTEKTDDNSKHKTNLVPGEYTMVKTNTSASTTSSGTTSKPGGGVVTMAMPTVAAIETATSSNVTTSGVTSNVSESTSQKTESDSKNKTTNKKTKKSKTKKNISDTTTPLKKDEETVKSDDTKTPDTTTTETTPSNTTPTTDSNVNSDNSNNNNNNSNSNENKSNVTITATDNTNTNNVSPTPQSNTTSTSKPKSSNSFSYSSKNTKSSFTENTTPVSDSPVTNKETVNSNVSNTTTDNKNLFDNNLDDFYSDLDDDISNVGTDTSTGGSGVIPIVAGVGAAAAIGVGAKVYKDRKDNNELDLDEDSPTNGNRFWSNDDQNVIHSEKEEYVDDNYLPRSEQITDNTDDFTYSAKDNNYEENDTWSMNDDVNTNSDLPDLLGNN